MHAARAGVWSHGRSSARPTNAMFTTTVIRVSSIVTQPTELGGQTTDSGSVTAAAIEPRLWR